MFDTSFRTLKMLAALVWYTGGIVLLWKGFGQLDRALNIRLGLAWPTLAMLVGILIGGIKGRYLFGHACRKNLARIRGLSQPKLWQFYRPGFFLFMTSMILLGRYLSLSAQGNYAALLAMAVLELSLATALLSSSYIFWQTPASAPKEDPQG